MSSHFRQNDGIGSSAAVSTSIFATLRLCVSILALGCALLTATSVHAEDQSLRITVVDRQVIFAGANLDIEELRATLVRIGRQNEVLTFRVGPNAKSSYISEVLKVVRQAGYSKLSIVGPAGGQPAITVDPDKTFD
jgi:hypothetical protein